MFYSLFKGFYVVGLVLSSFNGFYVFDVVVFVKACLKGCMCVRLV